MMKKYCSNNATDKKNQKQPLTKLRHQKPGPTHRNEDSPDDPRRACIDHRVEWVVPVNFAPVSAFAVDAVSYQRLSNSAPVKKKIKKKYFHSLKSAERLLETTAAIQEPRALRLRGLAGSGSAVRGHGEQRLLHARHGGFMKLVKSFIG
ncbi:unnamed protein product [Phytophthora lilii]|uniref:Unnamed protein product n=1 Tax=Phytophthora lilii TaxID=2077276 RepID=A0A9W6XJL4_9STRA|nr:unnamed protein product [Phytophthora lilii]